MPICARRSNSRSRDLGRAFGRIQAPRGCASARSGPECWGLAAVRNGPHAAIIGPVVHVELERVEALELLAMTLAHLNVAEASGEISPRVPLLMALRDKIAAALREES